MAAPLRFLSVGTTTRALNPEIRRWVDLPETQIHLNLATPAGSVRQVILTREQLAALAVDATTALAHIAKETCP